MNGSMNAPREDQDRADVERVLAGDTEAFAGIVDRWQGPLVNLAYRFCRDRRRAEEMSQEAFLRTFRFLDRWRGDAAFSTWLFALATNVYRSQLRRHRPEEVALDEARDPGDPSNPEEDAARDETARTVRRLVAALPRKYREALTLYYFMDMDIAAAAGCLGIPQGTLKARLHRARSRLRDRLDSGPPEPAPEIAR